MVEEGFTGGMGGGGEVREGRGVRFASEQPTLGQAVKLLAYLLKHEVNRSQLLVTLQ